MCFSCLWKEIAVSKTSFSTFLGGGGVKPETVSNEHKQQQHEHNTMGDDEGSATYFVTYMDGDLEGTKEPLSYLPRAGLARVVYGNGDTFEGLFNDMKQRHGRGTYSYFKAPSGEGDEEPEEETEGKTATAAATYTGDFRFGTKDGFGKMKYPNGSVYNGAWTNDQRNGAGSYTYPNGDTYTGRWSNDIKAGRGSYTYASNGSTLVGTWENGTMTKGKWVQSDNTSYHGTFNGSTPTGNGLFYFKSGNVVEGKYESKMNEDEEEGSSGPATFMSAPSTLSSSVGATAADLANFCERDPTEIAEIKAEIVARELLLNPPPVVEEKEEVVEEKGEEAVAEEAAAEEEAPAAEEE